jgi:hypothetical protein
MKKLAVTICLEMVIPDDWELVQTSEGVEVLKMTNNQFLDLTFEPMVTDDKEGQWSNAVDDDFIDNLLDMVETEDVTYKIITN